MQSKQMLTRERFGAFSKLCIATKVIATVVATTVYWLSFIGMCFCNGSILFLLAYTYDNNSWGVVISVSALTVITLVGSVVYLIRKKPSRLLVGFMVFLNVLDIIAMVFSIADSIPVADSFVHFYLFKIINILFSILTIASLLLAGKKDRSKCPAVLKEESEAA